MTSPYPLSSEKTLTVEQLYDSVGPGYEQAWAHCTAQHDSLCWIISQLNQAHIKRARCVDLGCGTGRPVCSTLAGAGHDVLGVDISNAMLDAARKNVPNAKFEKADLHVYDPKEDFDVITAYFSFLAGWTQNGIKEGIGKIYQWLKPGGLFVFATVPIPGDQISLCWLGRTTVASGFAVDETLEVIKKAGFVIEKEVRGDFMPKAVEAGICQKDEVVEEPHQFVYARKG